MHVCGWVAIYSTAALPHAKSTSGSVFSVSSREKCAGHTGQLPEAFTHKAHIHNSR